MWGNSHVRFGERDAGIRAEQSVDGARVPTLRDPTPSREDIRLTRQLVDAGKLLDITVHDLQVADEELPARPQLTIVCPWPGRSDGHSGGLRTRTIQVVEKRTDRKAPLRGDSPPTAGL